MTEPTQGVHIRRIMYASGTSTNLYPCLYDDDYDCESQVDVLDPVLQYDNLHTIEGYVWNGTRHVPLSTYHLVFDGVDDMILVPKSSSTNNLPLQDFTVEFSSGPLPTGTSTVFEKTNSDVAGWEIVTASSGANLKLELDVTYDAWESAFLPSIVIDNPNVSHHYEIVWIVGTHKTKFFIDGIEVANDDFGYGTPIAYDDDSAEDLTIYGTNYFSSFLDGKLYWLMISNTAKHTSNFTPPSLTVCPDADIHTVLRLALDEGNGTIATDSSGNENNGTITGATWEAD